MAFYSLPARYRLLSQAVMLHRYFLCALCITYIASVITDLPRVVCNVVSFIASAMRASEEASRDKMSRAPQL